MRIIYQILIVTTLTQISCFSKGIETEENTFLEDTIDYLEIIKFDKNLFKLIKIGEEPKEHIELKNKKKSSIIFPSGILCSDTIVFNFHGKVVDNNDTPIKGAKVELINMRRHVISSAISDSKGYYSIDAFIDKQYTFKVNSKGYYEFIMINFEPYCDEVKNVNIKLQKR